VPFAESRRRSAQLEIEAEWTKDRIREDETINRIRDRVGLWRRAGHPGVTPLTARLLAYWTGPARDKPLFFCQVEAVETLIYLSEVAKRDAPWIETELRRANDTSNPGLPRVACKMATGAVPSMPRRRARSP
jgi:type III restriction enzyme